MRRTGSTEDVPLSDEEKEALLEKDESGKTRFDREKCAHCGGVHLRACPRVRRLEFHPNQGGISVVEFFDWESWPTDNIIFPEDVFEGDEEE